MTFTFYDRIGEEYTVQMYLCLLYTSVSGHKAELKEQLPEQTEFDILEDASLSANQCIIETEDKMIDCSLDVQLQNLQEKLHTLAL